LYTRAKRILAGKSVSDCVSQVCREEENMKIRERHFK
jgi:hypothetical protein